MDKTIKVSIIYPVEPSYIFGLLNGLSKLSDLKITFLGSNRSASIKDKYLNIKLINIRGSQDEKSSLLNKIIRIIKFYIKLFSYCFTTDSQIYHLHFPNKILFIDFVILHIILKLRSIKIIYTAHNIDFNRDNKQNFYRSIVLKINYKLVDAVIVHNKYSATILNNSYPDTLNKTHIVRIGINIAAYNGSMDKKEARDLLGISSVSKTILFFGGINPYKGLEILLQAFSELINLDTTYTLVIAGSPRNKEYFFMIKSLIENLNLKSYIKEYYGFIPDDEVERFFKASDCCVLPYKSIFQSGVHLLSYSFGIPVIASDIGSFKGEDIIEGKTGLTFKSGDVRDLKQKILEFFSSELFNSELKKNEIVKWANENYSWDKIGINTINIYKSLINE